MTVRRLSPTGDMTFGGSALDFLSNTPETVAQVVDTSLLLFLGEWYLDTSLGCPWFQGVLGKHNQSTADITLQDYILNVQGVTGITSFTSNAAEDIRHYTAFATISTLYGLTEIQIADETLF
jgi:hypothetical protein